MISSSDSPKDIFLASLARCISVPTFFPAFYERFMGHSQEVEKKFESTDFEHQHRMLRRSLEMVASASCGDPAGLQELKERAKTHGRKHLDIRPELYQPWLNAVLTTAREHDKDWNSDIENAWQRILQFAIDYMVRRYDTQSHHAGR